MRQKAYARVIAYISNTKIKFYQKDRQNCKTETVTETFKTTAKVKYLDNKVTNRKTFTKRIRADYIRGMFANPQLRNSGLSESSLAKLCLSV